MSVLPLRIEALAKRFGELTAVDGVSLELRSGECLGLLGPNGAGKSTLIRTIVGRAIADSGKVLVFGARSAHRAGLGSARPGPLSPANVPRKPGSVRPISRLAPRCSHYRGSVVPGVGRACRSGRRHRCELLRRNETTAEHGRRTHPPSQGDFDGRADGRR
ncbi:MAG: hypothetical protein DMG61_03660 [Acidobacteria bacterium]|nr:MAG: hypothetical protein DMG61_03660 [Acidobacteriota bacterium]